MNTSRQVLHSSKTNEWYTPPWIIDRARLVMGSIDLDPASTHQANERIQATKFFTEYGLRRLWSGNVWLNPPYGRNTKFWVEKFLNSSIDQGMMLVNNTTDRSWFKKLWDLHLCFLYKRVKFLDHNSIQQSSPTHGNVLVYKGYMLASFERIFGEFGRIVQPGEGDKYE